MFPRICLGQIMAFRIERLWKKAGRLSFWLCELKAKISETIWFAEFPAGPRDRFGTLCRDPGPENYASSQSDSDERAEAEPIIEIVWASNDQCINLHT